jgi:hypothetical protein
MVGKDRKPHFLFLRLLSERGQQWLDDNVFNGETLTFGSAVVCEARDVEAILQGASAAGLAGSIVNGKRFSPPLDS